MKKILKLLLCLTFIIVMTSCGKDNFDDRDIVPDNQNNVINVKTPEEKLQEYIEKNKASVISKSNEQYSVDLVLEGRSIVYVYKYRQVFSNEQINSMKSLFDNNIANEKNVFKRLLSTVRLTIPETESIIIKYYDGNDTFITSIVVDDNYNPSLVPVQTPEEKLEDFVKKLKPSVTSMSNDSFNIDFILRGRSVVYYFKYKKTYSSDQVKNIKTALDEELVKNKSVYVNLLTSLRAEVPEAESVIVEYYNGNNKLITKKEYK